MTTRLPLIIAFVLTWAVVSCGNPDSHDFREAAIIEGSLEVVPIEQSDMEGVSWDKQPGNLDFAFRHVPDTGKFLELHLPDGIFPGGQVWTGAENAIAHMFFANGTMQIGIAPLPAYEGTRITVSIPIFRGYKRMQSPPIGDQNSLIDLKVNGEGDGNVTLSWTEVNTGDYDFNGEVNASDITPIAKHFGQSVIGGPEQTNFWIDGDHNNEVTVSDVTPIAVNFLNQVGGYNIRLDGNITAEVSRQESVIQDGLPPVYTTVVPGSELDPWTIVPVDFATDEGQSTVVVPPEPDTSFDISINGIDLYDLDGSGLSGADNYGRIHSSIVPIDPLRRILPGEDPDSIDIGSVLNSETTLPEFYDLPNGSEFALLMMFIPTVDLITGEPRPFEMPPGQPIWDYEPNVLVLPFNPVGHIQPGKASVQVTLTRGEFDSYNGSVVTSGGTLSEGQIRIDYGDGVLFRDSNGNGNFEDEARMLDELRRGITEFRLEQLGQLLDYAASEKLDYTLNAKVDGYDPARGMMELSNVEIMFVTMPGPPVELTDMVLHLSEYTSFASIPEGGGDESPIDPQIIDPGARIIVNGYKLVELPPELPDVYWGNHVVKII